MPQRDRIIFHCDMNAYFASVEETLHPELREVPMAICGDPKSRRGIILAKNERAKRFGVQTAETIYQALRKCPALVLRPARRDLYQMYCEKANAIYAQYTDLLERASIDESFLDVTGSLHLFGGDAERLANEIRERVHDELDLTISVGVSYNKFFAKMGSDIKKPNAVTIITRDNYSDILWPLPIREMFMVGKTTEAALRGMNIHTIGDLAQMSESDLLRKLGRLGEQLHLNANGMDTAPVLPVDAEQAVQSIGNGITFKRDLITREDILTAITALSDTVATRLRREELKCMTVQVTIKDANFVVITRQRRLDVATWLASELVAVSMEIIDASWQIGKPIRLLTVTAMKLVPKDAVVEQMTLFQSPADSADREKKERLELAMDKIRARYGADSIQTASVACNDLGIHEGYGGEDGDVPAAD